MIDTGFESTATLLRKRLRDAPSLVLDLFVLTHIDADHIEGSVHLLQDVKHHFLVRDKLINSTFDYWARRMARKYPEALA